MHKKIRIKVHKRVKLKVNGTKRGIFWWKSSENEERKKIPLCTWEKKAPDVATFFQKNFLFLLWIALHEVLLEKKCHKKSLFCVVVAKKKNLYVYGPYFFEGHLNNLDYTICVEDFQDYCGISYSTTNLDDFQMSGVLDSRNNPDLQAIQPTFGEANCYDDYVFIPRGHHPEVSKNFLGLNILTNSWFGGFSWLHLGCYLAR